MFFVFLAKRIALLRVFLNNYAYICKINTTSIMKRLLFITIICCSIFNAAALSAIGFNEHPKLVVGIVVDQMRWDYLSRYYDKFAKDGIKRLIEEGYSCDNTMIDYLPTVTALGHSSVYTGSTPALHGIAGNTFLIDGRSTSSVADKSVQTVGSDNSEIGQASPHLLLATTIGDQLRLHTDFHSKVFSISYKDRAAILPGGHTANGSFWYDPRNKKFITSTYYMDKLPDWVSFYNSKLKGNAEVKRLGDAINTSPYMATLITEMAMEAVKAERLGQGDDTDMLCISYSQTDAIGHKWGTRGEHTDKAYLELDKQIARLLALLDSKVGKGNYLLFLTADHGAAHNDVFMQEHKMPAGRWMNSDIRQKLNAHLNNLFGADSLVRTSLEFRFYLNHKRIADKGLDIKAVKAAAVSFLRQQPHVVYAFDYDAAALTTLPAFLRERAIRGWHAQRSGDIQVIIEPSWYSFGSASSPTGTTHSSWNPYDSHIPLLFFGWKVPHGRTSKPTSITDIAPTVCNMINIQMPNACIGNPIQF